LLSSSFSPVIFARFRLEVQRDKHIEYLTKGLHHLGSNFSILDSKYLFLSILIFCDCCKFCYHFLFLKKKMTCCCGFWCSRPWLCYWIIHSIALLGESIDDELEDNTVDFLNRFQVSFIFHSYHLTFYDFLLCLIMNE
jgi:protein farnesyltransferase subunit beta